MEKMTALAYLKKELGLTISELKDLPKSDLEVLKEWAVQEMEVLNRV